MKRTLRPLRSRRGWLALAAVVLVSTSCGSSPGSSGLSSSTTGAATPKVIQLAGGPSSGREAAAGAAPMLADSSMPMLGTLTFRYEGDLPALDSPAPSWFFAPGTAPDAARVQALAEAFGVTGELTELAADFGGGWAVGPQDGSAPALNVSSSAMLDWWFNPAYPMESTAVACAVGPDGMATDCPEPTPPTGVPDKAAAEAKAREIFGAAGFDLSQYEVETVADEWSANVTYWRVLDGRRSPIAMSIGFGAEGAVTWASGLLGEPQRGADYPRIGAAAGVQRLQDQNGGWYGGFGLGGGMPRDAVAVGAPEPAPLPPEPAPLPSVQPGALPPDTAFPIVPSETGEPAPSPEMTIEPPIVCAEPMADAAASGCAAPEPIEIVLTGVREDLTMQWAQDSTVWLLPAYTFESAEGGLFTVIAVTDEYLVVPEPDPGVLTEPGSDPGAVTDPGVAVEPVAGGSSGSSAGSAGTAVESGPGTTPAPTTVPAAPVTSPATTSQPVPSVPSSDEQFVGMTVDDAQAIAESMGLSIRVVRIDGVDQAVTADYSESRVNVAVDSDVITAIVSRG